MIFRGRNANGTDGTNLTLMTDLYELFDQMVSIAANTAPEDIETAVYTAAGYQAEDVTTVADINPAQVTAALAAIVTLLGQITTDQGVNTSDIAALPAATNAEVKNIVGRMLARETTALACRRDTLVLVRKLIKFCALLLPPA